MSTYTVAGVTYDSTTGRPISFDDSYTGPKNALVGEVTSDAGVKYGVYADSVSYTHLTLPTTPYV